jgi:hypothetical protein
MLLVKKWANEDKFQHPCGRLRAGRGGWPSSWLAEEGSSTARTHGGTALAAGRRAPRWGWAGRRPVAGMGRRLAGRWPAAGRAAGGAALGAVGWSR